VIRRIAELTCFPDRTDKWFAVLLIMDGKTRTGDLVDKIGIWDL
jgi:hypothetical protein